MGIDREGPEKRDDFTFFAREVAQKILSKGEQVLGKIELQDFSVEDTLKHPDLLFLQVHVIDKVKEKLPKTFTDLIDDVKTEVKKAFEEGSLKGKEEKFVRVIKGVLRDSYSRFEKRMNEIKKKYSDPETAKRIFQIENKRGRGTMYRCIIAALDESLEELKK